jgi:2'-hydroxyisoflavone reductase
MKLLILGGTHFLGKHLVESALGRGHDITLFNRGISRPDLFPDVEKLQGDRDNDLSALQGRQWDAVIDTSGYIPRHVRGSAELLANSVKHYCFISTLSVYSPDCAWGYDETAPLCVLDDESTEAVTGETYGGLKVLCEQAVEEVMPDRVLTLRPGLIVGPDDVSDRFTYWPLRMDQGGDVLAPGRPDAPVQFIDVRDLTDWTIRMMEDERTGVFNATGPDGLLEMQEVLHTCQDALDVEANLIWVEETFLLDHSVAPYSEMPLWLPDAVAAMSSANCQKAYSAGLTTRSLTDTVRDTLSWAKTFPSDRSLRAGMPKNREQALLKAWRQSRGTLMGDDHEEWT